MNKKLLSTLLLFVVLIITFLMGINTIGSGLASHQQGDDSVFYGILLLICSLAALIAILRLPSKSQN